MDRQPPARRTAAAQTLAMLALTAALTTGCGMNPALAERSPLIEPLRGEALASAEPLLNGDAYQRLAAREDEPAYADPLEATAVGEVPRFD